MATLVQQEWNHSNPVQPFNHTRHGITDFPTHKNITDIHLWFGLINQVSYKFSITDKMQPKHKTAFYWNNHLQNLFEESKFHIIQENENGVRIFHNRKLHA